MTRRRALYAVVVLALLGQAVALAVLLRRPDLHHQHRPELLITISTPLWAVAVAALARLRPAQATAWVLGAGAALAVVAVLHGPNSSDDDYRYLWDAKVQLSGTDPYRYAPSAAALAQLRDRSLFGAPGHCAWPFPGGCTSINRPTVHTIYPPVAEAAFDVVRVVSFGGRGNQLPLQLAGALGSLVIGWLVLRRRPDRPWLAAVWTWCPVTVIEYANNAHIDWLAVLLIVLALERRSRWAAGALVGAAVAVKLYPALVLPSLMRRSWVAGVAALGFVALVYVPHVLAVGSAVLGYLPTYLQVNGYQAGNRLLLLNAVLSPPWEDVAAVVILGLAALWALVRGPRDAPERSAVLVVGVAFLVVTPNYSWYAGILLGLVAVSGSIEWLPLAIAPTYAYLVHSDHDLRTYTLAALASAVLAAIRHIDSLRGCLPSTSRGTVRSRS